MRNLVPHGKDISQRQYNEEERDFIIKYGGNALYHWELMTDEQKADYEKLERYCSDFATLFSEHYEDLKLYAIMYRNVPLYNIENDIYSILYFASHRDEIIGYKERLMSDKTSPQAQVTLLYSENEALFPKFCIKYANVNFQPNKRGSKDWELSVNSIKDFRDGKIPHVFSVSDLTDEQCWNILKWKRNRRTEYKDLYNKYLGDCLKIDLFKSGLDEGGFTLDCFVPLVIEERKGHLLANRIIRFTKKKIKQTPKGISSVVDDDINKLKNRSDDIDREKEEIRKLSAEKDKKEEEYRKSKDPQRDFGLYNPFFHFKTLRDEINDLEAKIGVYEGGFGAGKNNDKLYAPGRVPYRIYFGSNFSELREREKKIKEADTKLYEEDKKRLQELKKEAAKQEEQERRERKQEEEEIKALENEIKTRHEKAEQEYSRFLKDVTKTTAFRVIYDNRDDVEEFVNVSFERLYNIYWLRHSAKMKGLESRTSTASSIFELLYQRVIQLEVIRSVFRWKINQETKKYAFDFRLRALMRKWCEAVEEFWDEEEERKRKEEEARTAKYRYNQINAHPRDAKLSFDKGGHIYTVGGRVMDSVTTIIKNSFPEFDKMKWAPITAKKKGMTEREVLDMWEKEGEESREKGTLLHEKIESYYQGKQVYYDDTFRLFENMAKKVTLSPYRTEWAVYDYDLGVAGTVDFVDYQNGQYALYDWKRSEKVIVNGLPAKTNQYGEKGNYPIGNLDNTPYWHYALQLSMYKYILEHNYGMEISRLRLGVFHPTYIKPYLLEMPYLEKEVNAIFSLRSEIIF